MQTIGEKCDCQNLVSLTLDSNEEMGVVVDCFVIYCFGHVHYAVLLSMTVLVIVIICVTLALATSMLTVA